MVPMRLLFRLTLLFCAVLIGATSWAHSFLAKGATLYANGLPIFTFRAKAAGLTPEERAKRAAAQLTNAAAQLPVGTEDSNGAIFILTRKQRVFSILPEDARLQQMETQELAWKVSDKLRLAFELPPIRLGENLVRLPVGKSKTVALQGSMIDRLSVDSSRREVVDARIVEGQLQIKALAVGDSVVTLDTGAVQTTVGVQVRDIALSTPQTVITAVTGLPATAETVRGAIESAIKLNVRAAEGADIRILNLTPTPVDRGQSATFDVRVEAFAPDCFPAEGVISVKVFNLPVTPKDDMEMWYCNIPERLTKPGPVFSSNLKSERPIRMLYHHVNDTKDVLFFNIQLVNDGELPAKVVVLNGDSQPHPNPVLVGAIAGQDYLRKWKNQSGEIVTIPPHQTIPLSIRGLYPQQVASGLVSLRLLEGGPDQLLLRADAREPFNVNSKWASALKSSAPWRLVGASPINDFDTPAGAPSDYIFPNPQKSVEASYAIGTPYTFVRIGHDPIVRQDKGEVLDGNYGVIYTIKAQVVNNTAETSEMESVFEPSAGFAEALFLMNGKEIRSGQLKPRQEFVLTRMIVKPGEVRKLNLITFPLSGSAYPCTLTFRPVGSTVRYGEVFRRKSN